MRLSVLRYLLVILGGVSAASASAFASELTHVEAVPDGGAVRVELGLSEPVKPVVKVMGNPFRLVIEIPNAPYRKATEHIAVNKNGVGDISVGSDAGSPLSTRVTVNVLSARPYEIESNGNTFSLSILPSPSKAGSTESETPTAGVDAAAGGLHPSAEDKSGVDTSKSEIQVTNLPVNSTVEDTGAEPDVIARRNFNVKYIVGNTVYINGGTNSGLRAGMNLDIVEPQSSKSAGNGGGTVASVRVIGVATTSAITEVNKEDGSVRIGDVAELASNDVPAAEQNAKSASRGESDKMFLPTQDISDSSSADGEASNGLRPSEQRENAEGTRIAGRIGFDASGISSHGSTPGTSMQKGMSIESDMTHILGTHWNLQGYWRGRTNQHSQFQEPTIEESLNKTYTMQLFYDNPQSKWAAGVGRLYLPWAVSLDTIDGGYIGRKLPLGATVGAFAGSTPDINSWDYTPNHRIGGPFVNFAGGDYEKIHYSSTTGLALNSIGWKLDRPYVFFENEFSYKNRLSLYHSLIVDKAFGPSTDGMRLGTGISHSYFTAHYQPGQRVSFDFYHNYFRDVPTATTAIVGTGLVDKLLFQGASVGVHARATRNVTLYTTLGVSDKTGDLQRSMNQMYGASWDEIAHTGFRADLHYSKFNSNFGIGDYKVFSLSRQMTNRAFWNLQVGKQDLLSSYTKDNNSVYIADSMDVNIGRRSYFQSGYTFVNGASLNYRQWYFSWGIRLDDGKNRPEYVESSGPVH